MTLWVMAVLVSAPLELDSVLGSTRQHYPKLLAAEEKVDEARGKLLGNRGVFDLKLGADAGRDVLGFYERNEASVGLKQSLSFGGIDLSGGYRYGEDFPPYDGKLFTSDQGEGFLKANIPLWQDRAIDARRLGVRVAEVEIDLAQLSLRQTELEILGKATTTYWKWVATGQKLEIVERLLKLAETRQQAVERQVQQGSAPEILLRDNMRLIVSRRGQLVGARRDLREAALQLSLFIRDGEGTPILPDDNQLPEEFPEPIALETGDLNVHLEALPETRPDLLFFEQVLQRLAIERRFGENLGAPTVDVSVEASQDAGDSVFYGSSSSERSINETELGIGLTFELPIQRRKGRGEVMRTSAATRRVQADLDLAGQEANTELRRAFVRLNAAREQVDLDREAYQLSLQLEEAERRRFQLGQSNLLFVNQREITSADDASKVIEALRNYQEAVAFYRVARGVWGSGIGVAP